MQNETFIYYENETIKAGHKYEPVSYSTGIPCVMPQFDLLTGAVHRALGIRTYTF